MCKMRVLIIVLSLLLIDLGGLFSEEEQSMQNVNDNELGNSEDVNVKKKNVNILPQVLNASNNMVVKSLLNSGEYLVTPGDTYLFVIVLHSTSSFYLTVHKDYSLEVPFLGSLNTQGMKYSKLRESVLRRIKQNMPVDYVEFTLVNPAEYEVFVSGYVEKPGIVIANPAMRLGDAINIAGGIKNGGSFRKIKFSRKNGKIFIIDLLCFNKTGDVKYNPNLQPGDKVFVPKADIKVEVEGAVLFPGNYELIKGENLADLLVMAGGVKGEANMKNIRVRRISSEGTYVYFTVNYEKNPNFEVKNEDVITVESINSNPPVIVVEGALYGKINYGESTIQIPTSENSYLPQRGNSNFVSKVPSPIFMIIPFYSGINLYFVLNKLGGPTPYAIYDKCLIINSDTGKRFSFNVKEMWTHRKKAEQVLLEPGDHIIVPMENRFVVVSGEVFSPGVFPYMEDMSVADYVFWAGGIKKSSDSNSIFLYDKTGNRIRKLDFKDEIKPGYVIFVDKSFLVKVKDFVSEGIPLITSVISFGQLIFNLINSAVNAGN